MSINETILIRCENLKNLKVDDGLIEAIKILAGIEKKEVETNQKLHKTGEQPV